MFQLSVQDIHPGEKAGDKEEAIRQVAAALVQAGNVAEGYVNGMLAREQQTSTFLGNGIAIPHGTTDTRDQVLKTGVMKVGLSKEEIELLGREGHNVTKVSRRDLPFVVAAGKNGATTVASTMIIAALAGIKVFATGGIGGVHRGAEHTFDISADLQELANTNVTVVCAGAKSILDLGLTTEYLETFGVPLIGYQTKALPAFFCRTSPFDVSIRLDSASEIARAMVVKWQSGLNGGLVVANPIPEQFAMPEHTINAAIDQAVAEAEAQGVIGKESTPFLLARVAELTGGDSLKSNIQLVFNNAILASEIAKEYQRLAG